MGRPIPGMIYGHDYLKPKERSATDILRLAAGAPSLQAYLQQVANPNSIYTAIRDAAWNQMQATGASTPDPRVVANLDRARAMPAKGRFVMVNSATQMLYMYDNGVPVGSMKVVVGDYNKYIPRWMPTPLVASMMFYVIHNPYWNAPDFLVRKNIAPRYISGGDKYFQWRGYKVMSDWTKDATVVPASQIDWKAVIAGKLNPRVRQDPGPSNFMGQLKFPFANPEGVYLHDTDPEDSKLFAVAERTRSNGCVRLEDAPGLARWLLGHDAVAASSEPEFAEQLPRGVPIYLTYLTAIPANGQLTFVKDIYGWDNSRNGTQSASR
jgi:murein L,D-transpeptidase YcbB/YkuD